MRGPYAIDDNTPECDRRALIEREALYGIRDAMVFFPDTSKMSEVNAAKVILFCVQQLPFIENPLDKDIYIPVKDTVRMGGDCKAKTALLLSGLWSRGIRAQALWVNQNGFPINHVFAALTFDPPEISDEDASWILADASIRGALLGESPYDAAKRLEDFRSIGSRL